MTHKLSEIDLDEVSLVDKGAVNRRFLIIKKQEVKMDNDLTLEDVENTEVEKKLSDKVAKVEEKTEKAGSKFSKETKAKLHSIAKDILSLIEEEVEEATEVKKEEPKKDDTEEILSYVKTRVKELVKP